MGLIAMIVLGIVGLAIVLAAVAGGLYLNDYAIEATVIDKDCGSSGGVFGGGATSKVTVRTKAFGIEHTLKDFDNSKCQILRAGEDGNFAVYHVRSERTILYEREGGSCIYDSAKGLGC